MFLDTFFTGILFQLFLKLYEHQNPSTDSRKFENSSDAEREAGDDGGEEENEENVSAVGSVFERPIQSLQDLKEHMSYVIVEHVVQGFRLLSKPYKKEK